MIGRTAIFVFVVVMAGTGGEMAVSRAMKEMGEELQFSPRRVLKMLRRALSLPWMWFGLSLMATAFFAFLALLSWQPVSFAVPATASSYVVGAFGGKFLLREQVAPARWAGVLLVCAGVALICMG